VKTSNPKKMYFMMKLREEKIQKILVLITSNEVTAISHYRNNKDYYA
jgi:hypothetical protein